MVKLQVLKRICLWNSNSSIPDLRKLMGLFCNDVIEEFEKDFEESLAAFEKKECKQITKYITPKVLGLVKDRIRK